MGLYNGPIFSLIRSHMQIIKDQEFLEKLIIKSMLDDAHYGALILNAFDSTYFDTPAAGDIFLHSKDFFLKNKKLPEIGFLAGIVNDKEGASEFLKDANSLEINVSNNLGVVIDETEAFLKKAAMKVAILSSADIVNGDGDYGIIDRNIKNALAKSLKFEIGTNYWDTLGERLQRIFTDVKRLIPSYYPTLDELIAGGFPPKTLSVIAAATFGGKSLTMINIAARMVMHGYNVVYFTLEMSEDMVAQRFDSIYSGLDINAIYVSKKKELTEELKKVKENSENSRGKLFIKEFPTKSASVLDLKSYLIEHQYRNTKIDIAFIDYLGLLVPMKEKKTDNSYESVKRICEESRGMAFEFDFPLISASQFNRGGAKGSFSDLSNEDVAESYGLSMTMDFGMALGFDEDAAVYKNELSAKLIKNRFGGRINEDFNFYVDPKSLKIYDATELDAWMDDAIKSGSKDREMHKK